MSDESLGGDPLVIIGAGRSGTNMLRDCLCALDGWTTWPCDEINYIWRHGNRAEPTDEFPPALATASVRRFIRGRVAALARTARPGEIGGPPVLVEKTCANSLRVGFVDAVLPEARFVHIVRDGRDVVASAMNRWTAPLEPRYLFAKARYVPVTDLPYYASRYALDRLGKLGARDSALPTWGPRFDGMRDVAEAHGLEAVCAAQWSRCVDRADAAFEALSPERVVQVRYEDFVRSPGEHVVRIARLAGRDVTPEAAARATVRVKRTSVGKGRAELPERTMALMDRTLARHGYA